jgi:predicted alpha/beta-fold hydrolase
MSNRMTAERANPGFQIMQRRRPRPYSPARWLRGRHMQTILPALLRRPPAPGTRRARLELPDGDFLDVDWVEPDGRPRGVAVVVHGLEGSSQSPYVLGTLDAARRRRLVGVAMNQRGCSGEPNRLARSYHSGETGDLGAVLDWTLAQWPDLRVGVIGFSLGGNQTLKYLGERGVDAPDRIAAAVAVSPPFSLQSVSARLDSPAGALYRFNFLKTLAWKTLAKAKRFPDDLDRGEVLRTLRQATLRAFDDKITAPIHGFRDADDYYDTAACGLYLEGVRRPALILTATDDPIIPGDSIPYAVCDAHPDLKLIATDEGGHVGFVSGPFWQPRFWAEQQAVLWLARRLG